MKKIILLFLSLALMNCNTTSEKNNLQSGPGVFTFQNDSLNYGRPLEVYYYVPSKYSSESRILIVMHGNGRSAQKYRDAWIDIAEKANVLLIVPEFSRKHFPKDQDYNMGHMFKMDEKDRILARNAEPTWSYSLIDPIFEFTKQKFNNSSKSYFIYGHSAGSQFVHRFLFFKPKAKVAKAICANAGWYTMPDFNIEFPYGLKKTECKIENLKELFKKQVIILLGDADTDENHPQLRRTPEAMKQGKHRFERGQNFFKACQKLADSLETPFNWKLVTVPGVAHSNRKMAPAAAKVLFEDHP